MKKSIYILVMFVMILNHMFIPILAKDTTADEYVVSEWAKEEITVPLDIFGIVDFTANVTREQFCEILVMLTEYYNVSILDNKNLGENSFLDVTNDAITALYDNEFIYGKSDGYFFPSEFITREDVATILFRVFYKLNPETKLNQRPAVGVYEDDEDISWWSYTGVYILSSNPVKIMNGVGEGRFCPRDMMTAEQAIVTIIRLCNYECNK